MDTKILILENIDFHDGKVTYNDFDIDPEKSFEEQIWSYEEDLLQISYKGKYLIDVGWYPSLKKMETFDLK